MKINLKPNSYNSYHSFTSIVEYLITYNTLEAGEIFLDAINVEPLMLA